MGQLFSKRAAKRAKLLASPLERAEDLPMPSTIDLSQNSPDVKELDGRLFKKSGNATYPFPNDKEVIPITSKIALHACVTIAKYVLSAYRRRHSNYQAPLWNRRLVICKYFKLLVSAQSEPHKNDTFLGLSIIINEIAHLSLQELATEFPNSTFIGTDITNVFLATAAKSPPNLEFLEADTLAGLPFEDNTFDYVFQRLQSGNFSVNAWPGVLRELLRVAKPGSYIELLDSCPPKHGGPAFTIHSDWFYSALHLRDVNPEIIAEPSLLIGAGFVDLVSQYIPWHICGGADATINEWSTKNWSSVIDSTRPQLTASLGISDSEYNEVAERAKKEITDPSTVYKPYNTLYSHYGRKPMVQAS
ncbi:hypothetical protein BC937DRAFT_91096 [Endogone sp. FLAS-F59071]|nr:hypothetical protein BC937DRAFT_91096 [Endogone sp. FLAS-F59071]|eukprot:RUS16538.1 hypothetical protein BC937DRAFT_91096 [Endogone sp. FLAS-F59071]